MRTPAQGNNKLQQRMHQQGLLRETNKEHHTFLETDRIVRRATLEKTAVRSSAVMEELERSILLISNKELIFHTSVLPLKAEAPVRAMPYPIRTAEGVAKAATREGFAATKDDIEAPLPVSEPSQSTASLNKKGT